MRRADHCALAMYVLALASACTNTSDLAQTVVMIDAEPAAKKAISQLRVQAEGPSHHLERTVETGDKPDWPIKLVLAPKNDDASRRYVLHIEARDSDGLRLMSLQVAGGFITKQTRWVRLMIHATCTAKIATCQLGDVCNVWDLKVDDDELGTSAKAPHELDATCSKDDAQPGSAGSGATGATVTAGGSAVTGAGGASGSSTAGTSGQGNCATGYVMVAGSCTRDLCAASDPCGSHGQCQNVPASYTCSCDNGYQFLSNTCVKQSDCQANNGGCDPKAACDDSSGSVTCACPAGSWLLPDHKTCAAWGPPRRISGFPSAAPMTPQFAFDGAGNGLAVWVSAMQTQDGTSHELFTRKFDRASGWQAASEKLAIDDEGEPRTPNVSLGANGRGAVVWIQYENDDGDAWGVIYHDQTFDEPGRIDREDTGDASEPVVAVNSNGEGFAVWPQAEATQGRVWVNRLAADGWQTAAPVTVPMPAMPMAMSGGQGPGGNSGPGGAPAQMDTTAYENAFGTRLAVDSHGNATLVWTQSRFQMGPPSFTPWTTRFDPSIGHWRPAVALDTTGYAGYPDAQIFDDGEAIAVWPRNTAGKISIRASSQQATGMWKESVNIGTVESQFTSITPRVAVSPTGTGGAIWTQFGSGAVEVWGNQFNHGDWADAKLINSLSSTTPAAPELAVDPRGDGFGIWAEVSGTSREIKVERLEASGGFIGGTSLTNDDTDEPVANSAPRIAIDADGRAIAIWDVYENDSYSVWVSQFQ